MPDVLSSAFKKGIPSRFVSDLSKDELFDVEFEENYRRQNLSWQDEAVAFLAHYSRQQAQYEADRGAALSIGEEGWEDEELPYAYCAGKIGVSTRHYRRMAIVGRKVLEEDPEVLECESSRAAGALLDRRMKRIAQIELASFGEIEAEQDTELGDLSGPSDIDLKNLDLELETSSVPTKVQYSILNTSFEEFIDEHSGGEPKFNFVHCDFPYGKDLHKSKLYKTQTKDMTFKDTKEIYWSLCHDLLDAKNSGVLSRSCHIMFWFPMDLYTETFKFFTKHEFRIEPYPLVWIKSDKMGLIPDPTRGPRRIYETAFIMSLGDRKIIKPTVNGNWSDSGRRSDALHVSSKPVGMLQDFTRMFIDSDSVVLDPTCGSGTILEVALLQRAKFVVGLDISPTCVEHSMERVQAAQERILRGA